LPGNSGFIQDASLIINDSGKFEDRWVFLKTPRQPFASLRTPFGRQDAQTQVSCVWAKDLPEVIYLPVAHGEGKFVTGDKQILERLKKKNQIVFQYCDEKANRKGYPYNPNGSLEDIAGICDETGRILGLMPHPERHIDFYQHPGWTHIRGKSKGDGLQIFRNGVEYAKKQL
jgi:phosphoribosylformylglycinamidine synthase